MMESYTYRDRVFQVFQGQEVLSADECDGYFAWPDYWYWEWMPQQCDRAVVFSVGFATKGLAVRDAKRLTDRLREAKG